MRFRKALIRCWDSGFRVGALGLRCVGLMVWGLGFFSLGALEYPDLESK